MGMRPTFTAYPARRPERPAAPETVRGARAVFNETANNLGQVLYAKQEPRKFERGTDLLLQSNPPPFAIGRMPW